MKVIQGFAILVVCACGQPGSVVTDNAVQNATVESNDPPSSGNTVVWRDTKGTVIPFVRLLGDQLTGTSPASVEFLDPTTRSVWVYSPAPTGSGVGVTMRLTAAYSNSDCTGTEYVMFPPVPRYTFTLSTNDGAYYVVPDTVQPISVSAGSFIANQSCQTFGTSGPAVPVAQLTQVTIPSAPPGKPPYHPALQ